MAANQNVTQLTQQTGSANLTSLFYAVTGSSIDTGLPLSVLVNNLGLTGIPTAPTAAPGTSTTQIASTAYVVTSFAPLASPTFTGTVTIPTPSVGSNTTVAASTAFVNTIFAAPPAIGNTTPAAGTFTTLSASTSASLSNLSSSNVTVTGGTINGTSVGGTTASTGAFTTLSASSTVSGAGFTTYLASPPAIGGTAANTGAFTTLTATTSGSTSTLLLTDTGASGVNLKLTGNGGTTPSKTLRVNSGQFQIMNSAYSVILLGVSDAGALSTAGSIAPSTTGGIVGTTLADSANAGSVGEYLTNTTLTTSMTNSTAMNATSVSLTAGDWDVWGVAQFNPAGTTTTTLWTVGINTTSAVRPANFGQEFVHQLSTAQTAAGQQFAAPMTRINVSTTTTVYLVCLSSFAVSTQTVSGFIAARRVR